MGKISDEEILGSSDGCLWKTEVYFTRVFILIGPSKTEIRKALKLLKRLLVGGSTLLASIDSNSLEQQLDLQ